MVVIRAEWCGICADVQPSIDAGYAPFANAVDLVVLDVTDDDAMERAAVLASEEGTRRFFDTYRNRTPTVGVFVQWEDGRVVRGPLQDPDTITQELEFALKRFQSNKFEDE